MVEMLRLQLKVSSIKTKNESCMMDIQNKNRKLLKKNHVYDETMEHDAWE